MNQPEGLRASGSEPVATGAGSLSLSCDIPECESLAVRFYKPAGMQLCAWHLGTCQEAYEDYQRYKRTGVRPDYVRDEASGPGGNR